MSEVTERMKMQFGLKRAEGKWQIVNGELQMVVGMLHRVDVEGFSVRSSFEQFGLTARLHYPKPGIAKSDLDQLVKLPWLQDLVFEAREMQSQFQDSDFAVLGQLGELRMLSITHCARVRGSVISEVANPQKLQWLCLNDCNIDDSAMEQIGNLQNLEKLMLSRTWITDRSLQHLQKLSKLEDLQLGGTDITDAGIKYLAPLSKLTYVNLERTKVTGRAVAELQKLLPTTNIYGP